MAEELLIQSVASLSVKKPSPLFLNLHKTMNVKCYKCGEILDVVYANKENEEGESYYEIFCSCDNCHIDHETSGWGEIDYIDEANDIMREYIEETSR